MVPVVVLLGMLMLQVHAATATKNEEVASVMYAESIPQEMDLATTLRTADAWADLIAGAQETLDIGQYYWTLSEGAQYPDRKSVV